MEAKEKKEVNFIVENINKIIIDRRLTKTSFSEIIEFPESKWNKISNGLQKLSVDELSNIAEKLQMREIDIITYPRVFSEVGKSESDVKTQLTIELKEDIKDKVLMLVFGTKNLELITNKNK